MKKEILVLSVLLLLVAPVYAVSCGDVLTGDVVLDSDLFCSGDGLVVLGVLDCNGHSINGAGSGIGIFSSSREPSVKNCKIQGFNEGIKMIARNSTFIYNNDISDNNIGIKLIETSLVNNVENNIVINNQRYGLFQVYEGSTYFANNTLCQNSVDVYSIGLFQGGNFLPSYCDTTYNWFESETGCTYSCSVGDNDADGIPDFAEINGGSSNPLVELEDYGVYTVDTNLVFHADPGFILVEGLLTNSEDLTVSVNPGFSPEPGVYTLVIVSQNGLGETFESEPIFFVVYDPSGGFATGGGYVYPDIQSTLPGGKANFGFVSRYKQEVADGNLEFQYHDADINLKSSSINWFTMSSVNAMFQGTGTINKQGSYTFRVSAKDDEINGDYFEIKIWQGQDTETDPIHKAKNYLSGGNIILHKK